MGSYRLMGSRSTAFPELPRAYLEDKTSRSRGQVFKPGLVKPIEECVSLFIVGSKIAALGIQRQAMEGFKCARRKRPKQNPTRGGASKVVDRR